jgi:hypothetical protein
MKLIIIQEERSMLSLFYLALLALYIAGTWKVYEKASQPGWAAIVPIYNAYILLKVVSRPSWWLILFIIPFVNIVTILIVSLDLAKKFGQSEIFGFFALFLFSFIGYVILGFGEAKYDSKAGPQLEA